MPAPSAVQPLRFDLWRRHVYTINSLGYVRASLGGTLIFYSGLLAASILLPFPSIDLEHLHMWPHHGDLMDVDIPVPAKATLWVFLPLLGLKQVRRPRPGIQGGQWQRDSFNTVQKERVAVQSWGLVADAIHDSFASTASASVYAVDVRIVGLVGNVVDCDPWLMTHALGYYVCRALPPECLNHDYDGIPSVDCIFETILQQVTTTRHDGDDVIVFANGDLVFSPSKLLAILSFMYFHPSNDDNKDAVLVGQRRDTPLMDTDDNEQDDKVVQGLLTVANFERLFSQALASSVLHADFGLDYFVLPARCFSSVVSRKGFPPFLIGRYRWDNALLASFILDELVPSSNHRKSRGIDAVRTIDVTAVLPVVHLGQHSTSSEYFQSQLGAQYNDRVAQEHFGDSYMLGRIHNTAWILSEASRSTDAHELRPPVFEMVKRTTKANADLLQAFARAYHDAEPLVQDRVPRQVSTEDPGSGTSQSGYLYPTLLLVTVLPRDVPYAKSWMQQHVRSPCKNTDPRDHFLFLTLDQDSYSELEAAFPGMVILEKAFGWPSSAVRWDSFHRLLQNRLATGIMSARDAVRLDRSNLLQKLWQTSMSVECDAVFYQHHPNTEHERERSKNKWDLFGIRPTPTGMKVLKEYLAHDNGEQDSLQSSHSHAAATGKVCLVKVNALHGC